jgi:methyl-accepting chemotaxis protein
LWLAHERAMTSTRAVSEAAQRIASSCAKHRGLLDGVADATRSLSGRTQEIERSAARAVDAFERLSVVALNASLEAVRLGEGPGRALSLVSDEVRVHAARGTETARGLMQAVREVGLEAGGIVTRIDEARVPLADASGEAARAQGAASEAERALGDVQNRLRKATGSDPEIVHAVTEAAEHARALVASLGTLTGRVPRSLLLGVLAPLFEPLLRAVDDPEAVEAEEGPKE